MRALAIEQFNWVSTQMTSKRSHDSSLKNPVLIGWLSINISIPTICPRILTRVNTYFQASITENLRNSRLQINLKRNCWLKVLAFKAFKLNPNSIEIKNHKPVSDVFHPWQIFIWFQSCWQRPKHQSLELIERRPSSVRQVWKRWGTVKFGHFVCSRETAYRFRVWTAKDSHQLIRNWNELDHHLFEMTFILLEVLPDQCIDLSHVDVVKLFHRRLNLKVG